jgi:hypothetical protein
MHLDDDREGAIAHRLFNRRVAQQRLGPLGAAQGRLEGEAWPGQ